MDHLRMQWIVIKVRLQKIIKFRNMISVFKFYTFSRSQDLRMSYSVCVLFRQFTLFNIYRPFDRLYEQKKRKREEVVYNDFIHSMIIDSEFVYHFIRGECVI